MMALLAAAVASQGPGAPQSACEGVFTLIEQRDLPRLTMELPPGEVDRPGTGRCARRTPLLFAAEQGDLDIVNFLVERGADVDFTVVEQQGLMKGRVTAECLAAANGFADVASLLRSRGAKDTVDGCRRRARLAAAVLNETTSALTQLRLAGLRLSLEQLGIAIRQADCARDTAWCAELARHLPRTESVQRRELLSIFTQWAAALPELKKTLPADGR